MNTFDPEQIVAALRALVESQRLRHEAEEGCRTSMKNCANDGDLEGWSPDEIEIRFERCALVFDHGIWSYPFVETKLGLYVRDPAGYLHDGLFPIGHYRLITLLDGTVIDDYFVLEKDKATVRGQWLPYFHTCRGKTSDTART